MPKYGLNVCSSARLFCCDALSAMRLVALVCLLVTRSKQQDFTTPEAVIPGGVIHAVETDDIYGHNVRQRDVLFDPESHMTAIDVASPLPPGRLTHFYFYAHKYGGGSQILRVQIWRPLPASEMSYQLVWQRRVLVNVDDATGALFKLNVAADMFDTVASDVIGLTNENSTSGVVSRDLIGGNMLTPVSMMKNWVMPELNNTYQFDSTLRPWILSVAVAISTPLRPTQISAGMTVTISQQGIDGFYGNSIDPQFDSVPRDTGRKSFVDINNRLPRGFINNFFFFFYSPNKTTIRIQVWRQRQNTTVNAFTLTWEKEVAVPASPSGALYRVDLQEDPAELTYDDYIGWTNEKDVGVLGYSQKAGKNCYFRNVPNLNTYTDDPDLPHINGTYTFDTLPYPALFYVATKVEKEMAASSFCVPNGTIQCVPPRGCKDVFGRRDPPIQPSSKNESPQSFIDISDPLPAGNLTMFYFYAPSFGKSRLLRVQIWRPTAELNKFKLVWSKRISARPSDCTLCLHILNVTDDGFVTTDGDYVGWTDESSVSAISIDQRAGNGTNSTLSCRVPVTNTVYRFPEVNDTSEFSVVDRSPVFSVAVVISRLEEPTTQTPTVPTPTSTTATTTPETTITSTTTELITTPTSSPSLLQSTSPKMANVSVLTIDSNATASYNGTRATTPSTPSDRLTPTPRSSNLLFSALPTNIPLPVIESMQPTFGPLAGGTLLTFRGQNFAYSPTRPVTVRYDTEDHDELPVQTVQSGWNQTAFNAYTPAVNATTSRNATVTVRFTVMDLTAPHVFEFRENPKIYDVSPRQHLFTGGTNVNINGSHLDSIANPLINITVNVTRYTVVDHSTDNYVTQRTPVFYNFTVSHVSQPCEHSGDNGHTMTCRMPRLPLPDDFLDPDYHVENHTISDPPGIVSYRGPNGFDRADVYLGFRFDGYMRYETVGHDDVPLGAWEFRFVTFVCPGGQTDVTYRDPSKNSSLSIKGNNLIRNNLRKSSFTVKIGDAVCHNLELTDNQLYVLPPFRQPNHTDSDRYFCSKYIDAFSIWVLVGDEQPGHMCGCLLYKLAPSTANVDLIIGFTIGLGVPFILLLVVVSCFACRRRRRLYVVDGYNNIYVASTKKVKRLSSSSSGADTWDAPSPPRYGPIHTFGDSTAGLDERKSPLPSTGSSHPTAIPSPRYGSADEMYVDDDEDEKQFQSKGYFNRMSATDTETSI